MQTNANSTQKEPRTSYLRLKSKTFKLWGTSAVSLIRDFNCVVICFYRFTQTFVKCKYNQDITLLLLLTFINAAVTFKSALIIFFTFHKTMQVK